MTCSRISLSALVLSASLTLTLLSALGRADSGSQDDPALPKPKVVRPIVAGGSLQAINDDYARQLLELERQRLERLGQLAARQAANEAAETYEELFRLAIANNLFREAEPAALEVLKSANGSPPVIQFLARTVDIIASADRGAFDESLADLRTLIAAGSKRIQPKPSLPRSTLPRCWRFVKLIISVFSRGTSLTWRGRLFKCCSRNRTTPP
jgi:hypothetical protein